MMVLDTNRIYEFKLTPTYQKFYSPDSSYGIYVANTADASIPESKPLSQYTMLMRDGDLAENLYEITILGKMEELNIGSSYNVKAKLSYSKKYRSWSYEVVSISQNMPKSKDEQKAFLGTLITPNQCETILAQYPNLVEDIVNGVIEDIDVSLVKGIGDKTWQSIKTKILSNYVIADILVMLMPLGVTYKKIQTLLDNESNPKILKQKLLENPYLISEMDGITFGATDKIALKLNPEFLVSRNRTLSFLKDYLRDTANREGHTYVEYDELLLQVKESIIECEDIFNQIIEEEKEYPTFLFIDNEKIGLKYYHYIETEIWNIINRINESKPLYVNQKIMESAIKRSEVEQGFEFNEDQIKALHNSVNNNFVMITGKSGCGKTTLARGLLNIYEDSGYSLASTSLSAKASIRIFEATGHQGQTTHRLLGCTGPNSFSYNKDNPLLQDVIFVDETTLYSIGIFHKLVSAVKEGAKLILCADIAQLSPIGAGSTFSDYLSKDKFQKNYLTKITRQAQDSGIIVDSNMIREGVDPLNNRFERKTVHGINQDMVYMFKDSRDDIAKLAVNTFVKTANEIGVENVVILSPRKSKVQNSSRELNKVIQDAMIDNTVPFVQFGETRYKLGARVIHKVNNYGKQVFNGMVGTIISIEGMAGSGGNKLYVEYPDKLVVEYEKQELKELELGFSLSVHSAQGSEYGTVIVVLDNTCYTLLDRTLLYTAVSRAKKRCLVIAEPWAWSKAMETNKSILRKTWTKFF